MPKLTDFDTSRFKTIVVDGMGMSYKYYYGLSNLKNRKGEKTGLYHGFLQAIFKRMIESPNAKLFVAWEGGKLLRKNMDPLYKAQRAQRPDSLNVGCEKLKDMLSLAGIEQKYIPGYEADDVAARIVKLNRRRILLMSDDLDWFQMMRNDDVIFFKGKEMTQESFIKKYGFPPDRIILYKILKGDRSDNIRGIPYFPNNLALEIANNCNSLRSMYKYIPKDKENEKWMDIIRGDRTENSRKYNILRLMTDKEVEDMPCRIREKNREKNLGKLKSVFLKLEMFRVLNLLKEVENSF